MSKKIIKFSSDTKHRKQWFTGISFSHPAKMSLPLQLWIIDNFTEEGETILDPMAGSGTILVACSMGRNVVTLELGDKFVQMQKDNWEIVKQRGCQLGYSMGTATILQGDARNLEGLLVDKCVFSPPHGGSGEPYYSPAMVRIRQEIGRDITKPSQQTEGYGNSEGQIGQLPYGEIDKIVNLKDGRIDDIIESNGQVLRGVREVIDTQREGEGTPIPLSQEEILQSGLPHSQSQPHNQEGQINLDKGEIKGNQRCIETSGTENQQDQKGSEISQHLKGEEGDTTQRSSQGGNSQCGAERRESSKLAGRVEEVLRSELADTTQEGIGKGQLPVSDMPRANRPSPSSNPLSNKQGQQPEQSIEFMPTLSRQDNSVNSQSSPQDSPQALQTPVDCVISSPPYEGSISGESHTEEARSKEFEKLRAMGYKINPDSADNKVRGAVYSGSDNNIGNLKGDTYLSAMLLVYQNCFAVLKEGGLMILVTKNFIRNKKQVRLDLDTIKLCEQAGFSFQDRWYRELASQSFWRTIYHQKYPDVEPIKFEDILVFKKV